MIDSVKRAEQLAEIFSHLPRADRNDQIRWHMESDGFDGGEIEEAMDILESLEGSVIYQEAITGINQKATRQLIAGLKRSQ